MIKIYVVTPHGEIVNEETAFSPLYILASAVD